MNPQLIEKQSIPCTHGWRPIETAPKDGTLILIYNGSDTGSITSLNSKIAVAKYSHDFERTNAPTLSVWEYGTFDSETSKGGKGAYVIDATHWQPLPKPPQEEM